MFLYPIVFKQNKVFTRRKKTALWGRRWAQLVDCLMFV
uniref:Uncharacterized protein n=1 Tax=Siphoviridae sp. ctbLB3 TaxID=2825565 RepID=A0A8S5PM61_9CAUD|nr:MAG TPA: hypothetical protein [Siphoviridae sp. ctbLB3]